MKRRILVITIVLLPFLFGFTCDPDETNIEPYVEFQGMLPKSLYVWNPTTQMRIEDVPNWVALIQNRNQSADKLIKFVQVSGFNRVVFFVGAVEWEWESSYRKHQLPHEADLAKVIKRLNDVNIKVYALFYLNDAHNDLSDYEKARDVVDAVHNFNLRYPSSRFAGIHGDQEPYKSSQYESLLTMNKLMKQRIQQLQSDLSLRMTIKPMWIKEEYEGVHGKRPFYQYAIDTVDEVVLMDYFDDPEQIVKVALPLLDHAQQQGKKAEIMLETGWVNVSDPNTFYEEMQVDVGNVLCIFRALHNRFSQHPAFRQLVIHDFAQFFSNIYGAEPYWYDGPIVPACNCLEM